MTEDEIRLVAESFMTFDAMYELTKSLGRRPKNLSQLELEWAMLYFADKDEFDKAQYLKMMKET